MTRPVVTCTYERHGFRIIGRCAQLDLVTAPWLSRDAAEEELTRAALKALSARQDDVCFVHAATVDAP